MGIYCNKAKIRTEDLDAVMTSFFANRKKKKINYTIEEIYTIFDKVEWATIDELGSNEDVMWNSKSNAASCLPRQIVWYLLKNNTDIPMAFVADHYGYSKSNVYLSIKNIEDFISIYRNYREKVETIKKICFS